MEAVIGALRVSLGVDTAEFGKGLKAAESQAKKFAKGLVGFFGITVDPLAIAKKLTDALTSGFRKADQFGKMAQSIGLPVEELSRLAHAADLSDVSVEALAKSIVNLDMKMVDAAQHSAGPAAKAFAAAGISLAKLKESSPVEVMAMVADRFESMEDGALKTNIAADLFGKKLGTQLIPMLNEGGEAFKSTMEEADRFNLTIGKDFSKAAEVTNDNLLRLSKISEGLALKFSAGLAPALAEVTDRMVAAAREGFNFGDAAFAAGKDVGQFAKDIDEFANSIAVALNNAKGWNAFLSTPIAEGWDAALENAKRAMEPPEKMPDFIASINAYADGLERASRAGKGLGGVGDEDAAKAQQDAIDAVLKQKFAIDEQGQSMAESVQGPMEAYAAKVAEISRLHEAGAITAQTAGRAHAMAAAAAVSPWMQVGADITSALSQWFGQSKGFAYATAVINTAQAVTKSLAEYGFTPLGIGAMTAAALAGAAQIATISKTQPGVGGGRPSVPSTSTTATAAAATPAREQRTGGGQRTLAVTGINPAQIFTGAAMRDLMQEVTQFQRDGGTVVLA